MRAAVIEGERVRFVPDYPDPRPLSGEVLIRVKLVGICGTDLELLRGYKGFSGVPGHEFVGVAQSGKYAERRVVGEINVGCGECEFCRAGVRGHCLRREVVGLTRDGAMAEPVAIPEENLHPVPDEVPDEAAVFTEPLAAALRVLESARVRPRDRVVVLGAGRLGQMVARVLALTGCRLTVIDRNDWKLGLLRGLGAELRSSAEGIENAADMVVECTGRPEGLKTALRLVKPMGTVVLKSTTAEGAEVDPSLVVKEVRVVGSRCGPFEPAISLLRRGLVGVDDLISSIYPLERVEEAFEEASRSMKVLLRV
ncbi:MAG: alcohol dehydrogenase catalytic domain-containing protein [Candidatus Korarchaeota archaeon]|nr:alcohol dehydrogenase catalytic domain-containing protein [Candidatus Korarchaeota archaeon]